MHKNCVCNEFIRTPGGRVQLGKNLTTITRGRHKNPRTLSVCHAVNDTLTVRSPDADVYVLLRAYSFDIKCQVLLDTGNGDNRR